MLKNNLKLTLVQTEVKWGDVKSNLKNYQQLLQSENGSDVYVLPEMFTTGFIMNPDAYAEEMQGSSVSWMSAQARELKALVMGSLIINENNETYNRFIYAFPDGSIKHYDKRHLFSMAGEDKEYSAGVRRVVIEHLGWKICGQICYDLRFPVYSRNKFDGEDYDYDLLVYTANWPSPRKSAWSALLNARAHENQSYVCGVNRIGTDQNGFDFTGDSKVFNPKGELMIDLEQSNVIASVQLDYKQLEDFRNKFPVLADADNFEIF